MELTIPTSMRKDLIDITDHVQKAVKESGVRDGVCVVYVPHATAGIIINEFEPNLRQDILDILDELAPRGDWAHNRIDDNAEAHLKSALFGCERSVPVEGGSLALGTWQRILLCEYDGPRQRRVIVKVIGR